MMSLRLDRGPIPKSSKSGVSTIFTLTKSPLHMSYRQTQLQTPLVSYLEGEGLYGELRVE
jgi:hypothetical protein